MATTDGGAVPQSLTTSGAVTASTEGNSGGRWINVSRDGKLVFKKSAFPYSRLSLTEQPPRPIRPTFQKVPNASLHQENKRCHDFIEWLEKKVEDQEKRMVHAEIGRAEDRKRAVDDLVELKQHNKRAVTDFGCATAEKKEYEKRMMVAEDKLASLEQREEALKIAKLKLKHLQAKSKTFQDLSDAVVAMGTKVEKASRDMKNSAARKSTPQSAFKNIRLVQLNEQLKQERDKNREEHAELNKTLQEQEISHSQTRDQNEEEGARLAIERQAFLAEKQAWHLQRGQTLSDTEFKLTLNVCVEKQLEKITPLIVEEARRYIWTLQEAEWGEHESESIANAKEQGYEDGYTEGLAEGRRIASADMSEIECEAYDNGYSVGYQTGKIFGMDWVEVEHEMKLPRIQEDAGYARETILLSTIRKIDYVTDGTSILGDKQMVKPRDMRKVGTPDSLRVTRKVTAKGTLKGSPQDDRKGMLVSGRMDITKATPMQMPDSTDDWMQRTRKELMRLRRLSSRDSTANVRLVKLWAITVDGLMATMLISPCAVVKRLKRLNRPKKHWLVRGV
ncbi:uncharacterized protein J4E84_009641 [Alternaria hordeiaustralica]|uniref:uncharacterized protein n=1 Tax=Alternaria hordeiaustralica TaxID=1187925 RepID=UPI0020C3EC3C|nr:uncharacterized protein J4E84_009641 [Alternaria hordeiaustralica]KAI4676244.1 hypothetical protein J4E84_009641 [Alternaria hordeiaustralica]